MSGSSSRIALANEGVEKIEFCGLANEMTVSPDGWVKLSPYGDFPHERFARQADGTVIHERFVQRLDKASAQAMKERFNSPQSRQMRFKVGAPIYKRHPDLGQHSPEQVVALPNDKNTYGFFADMDARDDGLYGKVIVSEAGRVAIENEGLKFISPYWYVRLVEARPDGVKVVAPDQLISGGLTDSPNIRGGQALANQNEQQEQTRMKNIVIGLLGLANEAGEADVIKALNAVVAKANRADALANEKKDAETALANERAAHSTTKTALSNERQGHAKNLIDQAIKDGRLTEAQRGEWTTALGNEAEFSTKATALANMAPTVKTTSRLGNLGDRKGEQNSQQAAADKVLALANERKTKEGIAFDAAFNAVLKENPALAEQMNHNED